MVQASDSYHKGSNTSSVRSLVVGEEWITTDHWLGLLRYVPFSALTGKTSTYKNPVPLIPSFSSETGGGGGYDGHQLT